MPASRRNHEGDGGSESDGVPRPKPKRKSKPTSKARSHRQKVKEKYSKAREDAQLAGIIPTTPEGAVRPEQVSPATQADTPHPELITEAIRRGWAVPEERKPLLVDELIDLIYSDTQPAKVKVAAFNALRMADQSQWDRDNPLLKGVGAQLPGAVNNTTNVYGDVVNNKIALAAAIREAISSGHLGIIEESGTSDQSSAPGISGQPREVEVSTPPEADQ